MHPVDEPLGDGDHADVAARLHAALGGPSLDPATRQRHLHAIRAHAATLPVTAPTPAAGPGLGRRLASTVTAAGLVVVMGASGAVAASHDALPGQLLYPVKQVTEELVLAAPLPTVHGVQRHLTFAGRRLDEAATLADRDADPALVAEAIAAHARLLARAGELAGVDAQLAGRVDAATATAQTRLLGLLDQGLPEVAASQARAALSAAEDRLDRRPAVPPPASQPPASPGDPAAPEGRPQPPATPGPPDRPPTPDARPTPGPPADPGPPERRPQPLPRQTGPAAPAPPVPAPGRQTPAPGAHGSGAGDGNRPAPSAGQQAATDPALPDGGPPGNAQGPANPAR